MIHLHDGLNSERIANLKMYPPPHLFAVISWGIAATSWLAWALNSHPDIFCVHAANHFWSKLGGAARLDGLDYLRVIGSQGSAHIAAGDVHGVSRTTVPEISGLLNGDFSCAVLVREPISRLYSQLALFEKFKQFESWNIDYLDEVIEQKLTLPDRSYGTRLFVHGVSMLNAILEEQEIAPIYRSEDLTTDSEKLCRFVSHITSGKVNADIDWAIACISRGKTNSHIAGQKQKRALESWQIDVIRAIVEPQAWDIYSSLGYPIPDFI